ncbi:flagellar assembly peptidoglycan hydrolase FlgJ [Pseudomonas sp. CFBP 8770]|jgi:flagellar protein FlgJ|uniref:flagellar assembly peptidoglycan hydrolase FlgJ n=1 Tax=unclassified Pseudomonas TaxID=196821 RepID=UPI000F04D733|nr:MULTISPECIES: flagellar assembly peptidoglycan hydrolase FlgJ [unclassified Pseudomonas]MBD8473574.1 flagellar assembly peptidoglycan hydrolase FlgJ [Pseudomonas sp. CFBP 8773]MBD8646701.1 flagellar assembly peptidoglycan hydrolase FlgJ [Pseudomonas sp. CFBP 8770]MBD8683774.1 flagellar assembly peptidoglycan hydrolase FlgJ [Pseudomonas sp. CFBP 13719]
MEMPNGGVSGTRDSGAYTDLNRLSSLKVGDRDSEANLRKVAQEFESLFLGEMLKSMRSANDVLAKDNPLNTETTKQYQSMYDQQLSVTLSKEGGGIGLQDVLMRQLSKTKGVARAGANPFAHADNSLNKPLGATRDASADAKAAGSVGHNDMALLNQRRLSLPSKLADRLVAGIVPSAATEAGAASGSKNLINVAADAPLNSLAKTVRSGAAVEGSSLAKSVAQPPLAPAKRAFASSDEFIATMLPMAEKAAARIGVDPKVLVAQAALETGWGKSIMRADDGSSSHNLFGIKATGNWKGENARAITSEFRDGQMVKETADFRSYTSYEDSFHDLVSLLQNNDRYQGVVKSADNPEQFVKELQKAGYATDPNYASKISSIAKQMQGYETYARSSTSATTNL